MTDVGALPSDWTVVPLDNCADKIADGEHLTPLRTRSGYFLLSARNVLNGRLDLSDVDFVGENEFRRIRKRCDPNAGDVLISCSGTVGRVSTVPNDFQCVLVRSAAFFKPTATILSGSYAMYFLQSRAGQRQIAVSLNQAAQANLFLNHIQRLLIPLPPTKAEQEAIAGALSDADRLIESLERLIAKKRQLKQAAIQELLTGKRRLPGFGEEWKATTLGEIGDFCKGSGVRKDEARSGVLPCVRYGELYTHHSDVVRQFNSFISESVASSAQRLRKGDVLFAGSGETKEEIGRCAAFIDDFEAYAGGDIVIFRPRDSDGLFLGYFLNSRSIQRQKASYGQGDAVVHISSASLGKLQMNLPSLPEQNAIGTLLSDLDAELSAIEAKLLKARYIKQGMMQTLLTGKIRLV